MKKALLILAVSLPVVIAGCGVKNNIKDVSDLASIITDDKNEDVLDIFSDIKEKSDEKKMSSEEEQNKEYAKYIEDFSKQKRQPNISKSKIEHEGFMYEVRNKPHDDAGKMGTQYRTIYKKDIDTGEEKEILHPEDTNLIERHNVSEAISILGDKLYFGATEGRIYSIDLNTEKLEKLEIDKDKISYRSDKHIVTNEYIYYEDVKQNGQLNYSRVNILGNNKEDILSNIDYIRDIIVIGNKMYVSGAEYITEEDLKVLLEEESQANNKSKVGLGSYTLEASEEIVEKITSNLKKLGDYQEDVKIYLPKKIAYEIDLDNGEVNIVAINVPSHDEDKLYIVGEEAYIHINKASYVNVSQNVSGTNKYEAGKFLKYNKETYSFEDYTPEGEVVVSSAMDPESKIIYIIARFVEDGKTSHKLYRVDDEIKQLYDITDNTNSLEVREDGKVYMWANYDWYVLDGDEATKI